MNYPLVIKVLGYTLWVEAGCMVLPLLFLALLPRSSGAGAVCPMRAEQPGPIKNKRVVASAGAYLVAYLLLLLVGAAVVAWGQNDFAEAFTISLACLSNIGPAMGSIGPVGDFSSLTEVTTFSSKKIEFSYFQLYFDCLQTLFSITDSFLPIVLPVRY